VQRLHRERERLVTRGVDRQFLAQERSTVQGAVHQASFGMRVLGGDRVHELVHHDPGHGATYWRAVPGVCRPTRMSPSLQYAQQPEGEHDDASARKIRRHHHSHGGGFRVPLGRWVFRQYHHKRHRRVGAPAVVACLPIHIPIGRPGCIDTEGAESRLDLTTHRGQEPLVEAEAIRNHQLHGQRVVE
jgi:hypothetical protein